jgi:hypothetical protein
MRHALLAMLSFALLLVPIAVLPACGGGGGAGSGNPEDARAALIEVLDAARRDDFARVRPRLDVIEWLASMDHPQASTYTSLPKEEQDELAKGAYRGILAVLRVTKLPDHASITTAVKGGTIENMPQLKAVQIRFQAPDAEREGRQLPVDAKLRYGMDGVWRLAAIAADL